jgi:hypothetical protein
MFGTIRKHSKWMWIIIVGATIVSFVIYFGPGARMGGNEPKYNFGSIDGLPITREDYIAAQRSTYLDYFFNHSQWPDQDPAAKQNGFNDERLTYERLLLMAKAKELGIAVSPETAAKVAADIIRNSGAGSPKEFEQRVLSTRERNYATLDDFGRFVAQFITIQQLAAAVGQPGNLVTPQEAAALWKYENQEISADLVFIPASNYLSSVTVTPEGLLQFYTNQTERYRVPAKVAVNYVEFAVTNYWQIGGQMFTNNVTNITEYAKAVYEQRGSNAFGGKALAEATEQIITETTRNLARRAATTNSQALYVEMTDTEKVPPDALALAAQRAGMPVRLSLPFDNQSPNPWLPSAVVQKSFTLNAENPTCEPIVTEEKVFLISLATNIASYIPAFEVVSNRVRYDYVQLTANQLAHAAGEKLHAKLAEGLAKGEKFGTLCTANEVRPTPLSPFSRSSRSLADLPPQVPTGLLQEAAFKVPAGKLSNYVPLTAGGFAVHVKEMLPLDEKKMQEEMPRVLTQIRQSSQNEAFQSWFRKQAETGLRDTPLNRPPDASLGNRAAR